MSVISRNPFDLLGDSDSPAPVAAPKPAAAKAPAAAQAPRDVPGSKAPRGRGSGQYSRGAPRNVLKSNAASPVEGNVVDPESGFEGERRAPNRADRGGKTTRGQNSRGRGGARPPRASRGGFAAGGDRGHDGKRSGNAHADSEKKVASGWGAEEGTAELTAEVEGAVDATKETADATKEAGESSEKVESPAADVEAKPVEEEDNTKSYQEYLAEKAQQALEGVQALAVRTVEGTSDFVGEALKKTEEVYYSATKKTAASEKTKAPKKEKVFLEFEGKFAPPAREGGAQRGGRGGFRGADRGASRGGDRPSRGGAAGRGRGAPRGGAKPAAASRVAVDDETAFPALGA